MKIEFETIIFGKYKNQPIEWYIIDKDFNKMLLISKYGLDSIVYSQNEENKAWETSDLRMWCKSFYEESFSLAEKAMIQKTQLRGSIEDKVFILSLSEAKHYFENAKQKEIQPTKYALARGVFQGKRGNCRWWLRSDINDINDKIMAAGVSPSGDFNYVELSANSCFPAVRPACWVSVIEIEM